MHKGYKSEKIQINVLSFFQFLFFFCMNFQIEMHFLYFFLHFCSFFFALILKSNFIFKNLENFQNYEKIKRGEKLE